MPRKPSYAALAADKARIDREYTVYLIALQCVVNEHPDASTRVSEAPGCSYVYNVYRSDNAHGGIVTITFRAPNQSPTTTARYWEDYRLALTYHSPLHERRAVEDLLAELARRT